MTFAKLSRDKNIADAAKRKDTSANSRININFLRDVPVNKVNQWLSNKNLVHFDFGGNRTRASAVRDEHASLKPLVLFFLLTLVLYLATGALLYYLSKVVPSACLITHATETCSCHCSRVRLLPQLAPTPLIMPVFPYCTSHCEGADGTGRLPVRAAISATSFVRSNERTFDGNGTKKNSKIE